MCCTTVRSTLITFLAILLLLAITRQTFDFIGRLWAPIALNFVHILFVIVALCGTVQYRLWFIGMFLIWSPFYILYNVFLGCFYMQAGGFFDRNSLYLSAGLRQSYSFWLRHTPFCDSQFELSTGIWQQKEECLLPYYYIEAFQSAVHICFTFVTIIIATVFICVTRRKSEPDYVTVVSPSKRPKITVEYSDQTEANRQPNRVSTEQNGGAAITNNGYTSDNNNYNDISSGYMNSSYEHSPNQHNFAPSVDRNGRLVGPPAGGYQRKISNQKRKKKSNKQIAVAGAEVVNFAENFSSATTAEVAPQQPSNRHPSSQLHRPRSRGGSARFEYENRPTTSHHQNQQQVASPIRRVPSESAVYQLQSTSEEDYVAYERRARSGSVKSMPFKQNMTRISSHDHLLLTNNDQQLKRDNRARSNPRIAAVADIDSRRLSSTEVKGLRSSTDSALNGPTNDLLRANRNKGNRQRPPSNLTSLVSFDPKSNTLIRVHEHNNQSNPDTSTSQDDETLDSSRDSAPTPAAPVPADPAPSNNAASSIRSTTANRIAMPPPSYHQLQVTNDRASYDSGVTSSNTAASSSGEYYSNGLRKHIGYEPALESITNLNARPRVSDFYEPIYKPSFYQPPNRNTANTNPVIHYHSPSQLQQQNGEILRAYAKEIEKHHHHQQQQQQQHQHTTSSTSGRRTPTSVPIISDQSLLV